MGQWPRLGGWNGAKSNRKPEVIQVIGIFYQFSFLVLSCWDLVMLEICVPQKRCFFFPC